ncbi:MULTISPECIES: tetratricopeptide repeat protein [unclassified Alteromonas]|uniref:tetratricopeptide repeat protein n=1 Tax=unclassified Alteromonas TaxID=2614992 RepID=UPI00050A00E1|nr:MULTISPECIES: tetratricopeptide repeat protein [unclassified Alteromonas]
MQLKTIIPIFFVSFFLVACEQNTAEQYIQAADTLSQKSQLNSAVLELKAAAQEYPNNAQIRLRLAEIRYEQGYFADAIRAAEAAIEINGELLTNLSQLLISSYYQLGEFDQTLALIDKADIKAGEITVLKYLSLMEVGDILDAQTFRLSVLENESFSTDVRLLFEAFSVKNRNDLENVISMVAEVSDSFPEKWMLLGKLYFLEEDYKKAAEQFSRYSKMYSGNFRAAMYLVSSLVRAQDFTTARESLQGSAERFGEHPLIDQQYAELAIANKNYENAKTYSEKAIAKGFTSPRLNIIKALSSYQLGLHETAFEALSSVDELVKSDRSLLELDLLLRAKLGYPIKFEDDKLPSPSEEFTSHLTYSLLKKGDYESAKNVLNLKTDVSENDNDLDLMIRRAFLEIGAGNLKKGNAILSNVLSIEPNSIEAFLLLSQQSFIAKDYPAAAELAVKGLELEPDYVPLLSTIIKSLSNQNDYAAARNYVEKLAKIEPANETPVLYYVDEAIRKKEFGRAKELIHAFLENNKLSNKLALTLYDINSKNGSPDDNISQFSTPVTENEALAQRLHVNALLESEQFSLAKDTFNKYVQSFDEEWQFLLAFEIENSLGNVTGTMNLLDRWLKSSLVSDKAYLLKVQLLEKMSRRNDALEVAKEGIRIFPNNEILRLFAADLAISTLKFKDAEQLITSASSSEVKQLLIHRIDGLLKLRNGKLDEGFKSLSLYYSNSRDPRKLQKIIPAIEKLIHRSVAVDFIAEELEKAPGDPELLRYYADAMFLTNPSLAIASYKSFLDIYPESARELNNLAWLLSSKYEDKKALVYIKQALKLEPENAQILSTYGQILLHLGEEKDALEIFKKLTQSENPLSINFYLNHAEALIKTNNAVQATQVLKSLKKAELPENLVEKIRQLELKIM